MTEAICLRDPLAILADAVGFMSRPWVTHFSSRSAHGRRIMEGEAEKDVAR